jgi:hypothetical protein
VLIHALYAFPLLLLLDGGVVIVQMVSLVEAAIHKEGRCVLHNILVVSVYRNERRKVSEWK